MKSKRNFLLTFAQKAGISLRSRREHKAWGVSPRIGNILKCQPMKWAAALVFAVAAIVSPALGQQKPAAQKIERDGVEVEFTIEPIEDAGKSSELMEAKE